MDKSAIGEHGTRADELIKRLAKRMGMKYRHTKKGAELRDEWSNEQLEWSNRQLDRDKSGGKVPR